MPCVHMDSTIISNVPWFWILQTSLSEDPRQYLLMTRPMPLKSVSGGFGGWRWVGWSAWDPTN
jgi:hypothetical protein